MVPLSFYCYLFNEEIKLFTLNICHSSEKIMAEMICHNKRKSPTLELASCSLHASERQPFVM